MKDKPFYCETRKDGICTTRDYGGNQGGSIRAIAADDEFVYVGGGITQTVRKVRKSDLSQIDMDCSFVCPNVAEYYYPEEGDGGENHA